MIIATELPLTELRLIEHLLRCTVTKLHVIYTCFYISFIKIFNELICKIKVVAKTTITKCGIYNLNTFSVAH